MEMEGTLLVDGFLASSYASFPHHASQLAYAPIKKFSRLLLDDEQSQHQDGCRNVVNFSRRFLQDFERETKQRKKIRQVATSHKRHNLLMLASPKLSSSKLCSQ